MIARLLTECIKQCIRLHRHEYRANTMHIGKFATCKLRCSWVLLHSLWLAKVCSIIALLMVCKSEFVSSSHEKITDFFYTMYSNYRLIYSESANSHWVLHPYQTIDFNRNVDSIANFVNSTEIHKWAATESSAVFLWPVRTNSQSKSSLFDFY